MKLNWFSPLPPAKTEIAHYTKRLLPALSSHAEVTLWTDQRDWDRQLAEFVEVRVYKVKKIPWADLNRADMTVYQIGNNPLFHGSIWQVSRRHPGVIVLHDDRLHHFFDGLYRVEWRDRNSYLELMERYYGEQGRSDADKCYQSEAKNIGYMAELYPLTQLAIENALGVVVHTREAFDSLAANPRSTLAYVPLPFAVNPLPKRPGKSGPPYRLILFGYLGRNRRLASVFKALAGMHERDQFHLDIFGNILDDEKDVHAQISKLNLKKQVTLHGFAPEPELEDFLSSSDLAINLRFPTMGEASASQLRIWAHALPSLVSKVGWYGSLPSDTVAFVRADANEIEDIQRHLRTFLTNPARFAIMGEQGRKELQQNHSPEVYASAVMEMAKRAMSFRFQAAYLALAERTASSTGDWLNPRTADRLFLKTATEIFAMASR
ncbi:MAG: glycosyltransferase [Pyrinomonadaceae bacterium]